MSSPDVCTDSPDWSAADITQTLLDNADFEEVRSVSKAKLFASAARRWLILRPQSTSGGGYSVQLNAEYIERMLQRATAFINANDTSSNANSGVRFLGMQGWTR
jgi:hypothetical protein